MKTKTVHQRAWCPMGLVTPKGILLSPSHVANVCRQEDQQVAKATTEIIKRIMAA